jgi:hypothetical protein
VLKIQKEAKISVTKTIAGPPLKRKMKRLMQIDRFSVKPAPELQYQYLANQE